MNLAIASLLYIAVTGVVVQCEEETEEDKNERISTELKLADWELVDLQEGIAKARKNVLLHRAKFEDEVESIVKYGNYLQLESSIFQSYSAEDIPYDYERNYTFLIKSGDYLMNTTDLHELFTFAKETDHLTRTLKIDHPKGTDHIGKQTFLNLLANSRDFSLLQEIWSDWHNKIARHFDRFEQVLPLVNRAALRNDAYDAKAYWEMLIEYENGYEVAENIWSGLEPTYRKLHEFVLTRINNHYETNFTEIPVYLTGSVFGEDWSNLADIIIPHQQMYKDAEFALEAQSLTSIYNASNISARKMRFRPGPLSRINFNYELCHPTLITYSASKYSEILTCDNVTWNAYLDAHEILLEAGVKNLDHQSLPRRELRMSPLEEAIVSLGSVIAIQNLPSYGFTPHSDYVASENSTEYGLAAKLLLALRVLPKLAYYMAVDTWRLDELQNPTQDIKKNWWEMRKKYQGVGSVDGAEADFLGDAYITGNRPYLAKLLGGVLQFELLRYHQLQPFTHNDNLADRLRDEFSFKSAVDEIVSKPSADILSYNYAISDITSEALTEFFEPLLDYLERVPLVPYPTIIRTKKLEEPQEETIAAKVPTPPIEDTAVQNDQNQPEVKPTSKNTEEPTSSLAGHSPGIYVLVTIGACFLILVGVLVFKKVKVMKRTRTNNRRFET